MAIEFHSFKEKRPVREETRKVLSRLGEEFKATPAVILAEPVEDGLIWEWVGGTVAFVRRDLENLIRVAERAQTLPWKIVWLAYDEDGWFVRKAAVQRGHPGGVPEQLLRGELQ